MNRHELYRPLLERTPENYQVNYMAQHYDFGKESRVARLIVAEVNGRMDEAEARLGIWRVRPFELYVRRGHNDLALPLFRPEYLKPMLAGGTFADARKIVLAKCLGRLREVSARANAHIVLSMISPSPWSLVRGKGPTRYVDSLEHAVRPYDREDSEAWRERIGKLRPRLATTRLGPLDLSAPESVVRGLVDYAASEAGLGRTVARHMVEELIALRNICCPLTGALNTGEMPMLATHVNADLSEEVATRFRRHAPVILTVWTPEEMRTWPRSVAEHLALLKKRIIRVCFEAYRQNGLLTLMDLQWMFQVSSARISELIRSFQREHNIVVPTPGTILDAGRSMTHKDIIVNLHLSGYTVKEIARITHHSPRAVDNYVGTFQGVLIPYLFKLPTELMAKLLHKGVTLVREHLELAERAYPDESEIHKYLRERGVNI